MVSRVSMRWSGSGSLDGSNNPKAAVSLALVTGHLEDCVAIVGVELSVIDDTRHRTLKDQLRHSDSSHGRQACDGQTG